MAKEIDNRSRKPAPRQGPGVFTAFGLAAEAEPLSAGLYVVATPIGNLRDVTFRALSVLAAAEAVLAEDTRVTKRLLAHYGITTPLVTYNEHSNEAVRERIRLGGDMISQYAEPLTAAEKRSDFHQRLARVRSFAMPC